MERRATLEGSSSLSLLPDSLRHHHWRRKVLKTSVPGAATEQNKTLELLFKFVTLIALVRGSVPSRPAWS
jgi:hypothetical protein